MKTVTATHAQNNFGEVLMDAQSEPVVITRNGKSAGVMLSAAQYREMKTQILRQALIEGERSGPAGPLDMEKIKRKARQMAGLTPADD